MTAVRHVAICHDAAGASPRRCDAAARRNDHVPTGQRRRSPNRRRRPVRCHRHWLLSRGTSRPPCRVTGGDGPPPSPPVTRPGSGSPSAPRSPATVAPQPAAAEEPFRARACREAGRVLHPPRPRPPRVRGGSPRKTSYRTDAGAPAPRPVPAGVGPRRPPRVPAVTLVPLPFAARVHLSLVLGRPAPDPVQLVRRQGVLEALGTHPATGADRLRPGCLARPRPVRGDWEEQLRIRLKAGGRAPPVTPFLR